MRILVSPEAGDEYKAAIRYYDQQFLDLGARLAEEIRTALRRTSDWPLAFPIERGEIRRVLLGRFPFKILYSIENDHIYVIALAHQHRKPDYWTGRTK